MHKAVVIRSAIPASPFSYPLLPRSNPSISNSIIKIPKPQIFKTIRFAQSESGPEEMDDPHKQQTRPDSDTQDTMSSFGEGYATRSDEEGFGGIYAQNQYLPNKKQHQPAPEFEHEQGSEVKEKEKARNQEKVAP